VKFTATTALPYDPLDRTTAGLRAELRKKVAAAQAGEPDWATLATGRSAETTGAVQTAKRIARSRSSSGYLRGAAMTSILRWLEASINPGAVQMTTPR
jgi:hypothetical protein